MEENGGVGLPPGGSPMRRDWLMLASKPDTLARSCGWQMEADKLNKLGRDCFLADVIRNSLRPVS